MSSAPASAIQGTGGLCHGSSLLRECQGGGPADAARSAGNHGDSVLNSALHLKILLNRDTKKDSAARR